MIKIGQIEAQSLNGPLGIFIQDVNPNQSLSDQVINDLTVAVNEYHLVLLKSDSSIRPESHIDLTKKLGNIWIYGYSEGQYEAYPEIFKVSNQKGKGFVNAGQAWHSDGSIYNKAMHLSIFAIEVIPQDGAATYFTSLSKALDRMPPEMKKRLEQTCADYGKQYAPHPVIWQHPITGHDVLHVSEGFKGKYVDKTSGEPYSEKENKEIDDLLSKLLWEENTYYEHQWQIGDLLIADNYALAHYAKPSNSNTLRVLHRTATKGVNRREKR
ncbi:MAG: TauD/TfdA family dioxygenase [Bacteroidota bacterium]